MGGTASMNFDASFEIYRADNSPCCGPNPRTEIESSKYFESSTRTRYCACPSTRYDRSAIQANASSSLCKFLQ